MPPKKPKMSPEERKAWRTERKALRKLAKIEKKKQLKRDRLTRELNYSEVTMRHHEKDWEQMLIKIALPHIRDDLEFAWHNFERVIDCKDFTISLLMDELKAAEDQYVLNSKNHIENIDRLVDTYRESLEEFHSDYGKHLAELLEAFNNEKELRQADFTEEENVLKTIMYALEMARKEQKQNIRADYFTRIDEEQTKINQTLLDLRGNLRTNYYDLQDEVIGFVRSYQSTIKERKASYLSLKTREVTVQELLDLQSRKLHEDYENIKNMKHKFSHQQNVLGRRIIDYEAEYNFFFIVFNRLKKRLITDRRDDFQKLNSLTAAYNATITHLNDLKARVEQILSISAVCRKLETQKEKITPFPSTVVQQQPVNLPNYQKELELFCQRMGQVEASHYAVNEEREFLRAENDILKVQLHRFCRCIKCPAYEKRTVVTVKHVTEGTEELRKYEKQGVRQFKGNGKGD